MVELPRSSGEPAPKPEGIERAEELAPQPKEIEPLGEVSTQVEEVEPAGEVYAQPEAESVDKPEVSEEPVPEPEEKKAIKLSEPTKELATRLLGRVSFEDRIIGVMTHPGPGGRRQYILSFKQATDFLKVDEDYLSGGEGWICDIHLDALKKWVGETLGDKELAQAIGEMTKEYDNCTDPIKRYRKGIQLIRPIKALMQQRLEQCKEVAEEETEA